MKAAIYRKFCGPLEIVDLPIPEILPLGALVRVRATGVCRSDWHGWQGNDPDIRLPHVPGHEYAGTVERVGSEVVNFKPGDRVTSPFVCGCGNCNECNSGEPQVCRNQTQPGFTHWGSFAEFVAVDNADFNLVKLPEFIDFNYAAILGCRFGTAFRAVVQQGELQPGSRVLIFGCGGVGFSALMIARAVGAQVYVVDIDDTKLKKALKMGATHCVNLAREEFSPDALKVLTGGGFDLVIEALGRQEFLGLGILSLRPRGRHIQVGLIHDNPVPPVPVARIVADELEVRGSHGISAASYAGMFSFIDQYSLDFRELVTDIVTLDRGLDILQKMDSNPPLGMAVIEMT